MKYNITDYKNKIIKVVAQNIKVDYKEPYKLEKSSGGIGTGFFIKNNYILTCSHCVEDSKDIYIEIPDQGKKKYKVELVGICPHFDIALLKSVEYKSKHYFELGDSDKASSGNEVIALGYPLGQNDIKITRGIISGRQYGNIQTDTPLNPGNSGGPLLYNNKVIGINKSIIIKSNNVGYTIPINKYNTIKKDLCNKTNVLVHRNDLTDLFLYNNTDNNILSLYSAKNGVYINKILNLKNILKEGDILTSFNKNKIDSFGYIKSKKLNEKILFTELLDYIKEGDKIDLEYIRDKKQCKKTYTYKNINFNIRPLYPRFENIDYEILDGIVLTNLSINYMRLLAVDDDLNTSLYKYFENSNRLDSKIIISYIYPNSNIANLDIIHEGDEVLKVNNISVNTIAEFRKACIKYTIINKHKYILLETYSNKKFLINVNNYINKSSNSMNTFKYPETELYKMLKKS